MPLSTHGVIAEIRSPEDPTDELFPVPGPAVNSVVLLPGEGQFTAFKGMGLWIESTTKGVTTELGKTGEVDLDVLVSDVRVAVACTHYKNGGGWHGYGTGGAAFAVIANSIGKAVAHSQTKGTSLVGHLRLEWIAAIISRDRRGWGSNNHLQIYIHDPVTPGSLGQLHVQLSRKTLGSSTAEFIMRRAAEAKAANTDDLTWRDALLSYAKAPDYSEAKQTGARTYRLPKASA